MICHKTLIWISSFHVWFPLMHLQGLSTCVKFSFGHTFVFITFTEINVQNINFHCISSTKKKTFSFVKHLRENWFMLMTHWFSKCWHHQVVVSLPSVAVNWRLHIWVWMREGSVCCCLTFTTDSCSVKKHMHVNYGTFSCKS